VAFGSHLNESYAMDAAAEVQANLGIDTRVVPTLIGNVRYLRVLGPEGGSEQETRDLLARAWASGYASAWYVAEPMASEAITAAPAGPAVAPVAGPSPAPTAAQHVEPALDGQSSAAAPSPARESAKRRTTTPAIELESSPVAVSTSAWMASWTNRSGPRSPPGTACRWSIRTC
jgi:hypothetical protein